MKSILLACATFLLVLTGIAGDVQPDTEKGLPRVSQDPQTKLIRVYEAFMTRFSDENPAWKTDIHLRENPNNPPALPRKLHYHDSLGYYSYRVKSWDELDDFGRFSVQNDPRLKHFIRENFGRDFIQPRTAAIQAKTEKPILAQRSTLHVQEQPAIVTSPEVRKTPGMLIHTDNALQYQFDPDELLAPKPLRLFEIGKQ